MCTRLPEAYDNVAGMEVIDEEVVGPNGQKRNHKSWKRTKTSEVGESSNQPEVGESSIPSDQ